MQNDLKSAVGFERFWSTFGAEGILAMAWWMGTRHAERIRGQQGSYPFLQLNSDGSNAKDTLTKYLCQTCKGAQYKSLSPRSSRNAVAQTLAKAGTNVTVMDGTKPYRAGHVQYDFDVLKDYYNGADIYWPYKEDLEKTPFRGSILINGSNNLKLSEPLASRVVTLNICASHSICNFELILDDLDLELAAFKLLIEKRENEICNLISHIMPKYQASLAIQFGTAVMPRSIQNWSLMAALVDALSLEIGLPADVRLAAHRLIQQSLEETHTPFPR